MKDDDDRRWLSPTAAPDQMIGTISERVSEAEDMLDLLNKTCSARRYSFFQHITGKIGLKSEPKLVPEEIVF